MAYAKSRTENFVDLEVPPELERIAMSIGPHALKKMVVDSGGITSSAKIAKVSSLTLYRWLGHEPGKVFRGRKDQHTWRSLWPGYPSPFPALDRVCEELYGENSSYLGELVEQHSWKKAMEVLHAADGFGMCVLEVDKSEFREVCKSLQIPKTSEGRLWDGCRYPAPWEALDHLAMNLYEEPWICSVIRMAPSPIQRQVPKQALAAMTLVMFGK